MIEHNMKYFALDRDFTLKCYLVLIYNASKYGIPLLVGQVLILNFSIFCVYLYTKKTYGVGLFQETFIFPATLIFEMNIQVKVEH